LCPDDAPQVINGQLRGAEKTYNGVNPFTQEKLWPVPVAAEKDLEEAVTAANAAFKKWSRTDVEERRKAMRAFADAIIKEKSQWAKLSSVETGKSVCFSLHLSQCYRTDQN
jgi:acyl-CoA reductase-like NAD-dependent aldehyde dehydrogenase